MLNLGSYRGRRMIKNNPVASAVIELGFALVTLIYVILVAVHLCRACKSRSKEDFAKLGTLVKSRRSYAEEMTEGQMIGISVFIIIACTCGAAAFAVDALLRLYHHYG